jgi:4,5-DOPA dioxygenase extradiol
MDRRTALGMMAASLTLPLPLGACDRTRKGTMSGTRSEQDRQHDAGGAMPVLFLAHGAPPLLDDEVWKADLARWGKALPKPKAILVLSAHWEHQPVAIGADSALPLVYDFYGFPEHYYRIQYPSPGAPALAARVRELLRASGTPFVDEPTRGLDHGTYVPLMSMFPAADVPVLQVSLPGLDPKELLALGRALAPLRREGVLVAGSGFLTHNLRALGQPVTPSWAQEFDAWIAEVLARRDVDALLDFEARAPGARLAHPRTEHFAPVIASVGAAEAGGDVSFPIAGWWSMAPAFSRRSLQVG